MAATDLKKRNEELLSELQDCKAEMGKLKQMEEAARLQWESMRGNHRALHQKNRELLMEKQKLEAEKGKLEVEVGLFVDKMTRMSNLGNENADLQRRIIALRKEREEIWNELQAAKAESQLFKEDFDHEREDRAKAHAQIDDIRTELTKQLEETRRELQLHKDRLSEVEAENQRRAGELTSALKEALASRQEVQAKASQVKQFKKQVDSLKLHVVEAEKQNTNLIHEMEKVRTELLKHKEKLQKKKEKAPPTASSPVAPPPPGWESRVADLERTNEELKNETDRLRQDNEVYLDEVQTLQKKCEGLEDRQHAEQALVSSHGFSESSKLSMTPNVAKQPPIPPTLQRQGSVPGSSAHGQQQQSSYVPEPNIMQHITTDIHAVAGNVVSQVKERAHQPTMQHVPYDPNLVCIYCNKPFRMGEIQKYRHHVEACNGPEEAKACSQPHYREQFDDIRTELTQQLEDTRRELQLHKERLSEVEAENERKAGELRSALEEALASRQEVQAKASQVKQLQKQVDTLQMQLEGDRVRLQQQLQRQAEEATQQLQLLQRRLDAALAEVQQLRHSSQIAPQSHKPWNIPRQEVEIFSEIGRGAWGTVYKGRFQGQSVAVKSLHPEILDEHTIERLRREVQIMAQVRHPNLLRFIGAVFDSQVSHQHPPLIVLELLDRNLRIAYQTKRLQGSSKIPIFRDIAYALHYLHEHHEPIIHRDVSAPNVLLEALPSGMWRAKVSDFGSANLAKLAQTMGEGAIIYAAPETIPQARELSSRPPPQTTKIDVFSYGVLLCEVITSQLPDPERFWIMLQQVEKQWPFMHKLIVSCIKQNADERPTMAEVLDRLNALPRPKPN